MNPGTMVWYEPSNGIMFAGVVMGAGSLPGTDRVLMCAHYWRWKSRLGPHRSCAQTAMAIDIRCLRTRQGLRNIDETYKGKR